MHGRKESSLPEATNKNGIHLELPTKADVSKGHPLFGNLNPFDILQHLLKQSLQKKQMDKPTSRPQNLAKEIGAENHNLAVIKDTYTKEKDVKSQATFHDTEADYEYDTDNKESKLKKKPEEDSPEYYYYYYYDYLDSGIDISHELTNSEAKKYGPLPTPLWQVSKQKENTEEEESEIKEDNSEHMTEESVSVKTELRTKSEETNTNNSTELHKTVKIGDNK